MMEEVWDAYLRQFPEVKDYHLHIVLESFYYFVKGQVTKAECVLHGDPNERSHSE